MKPTHQLKHGTQQDATCWQYTEGGFIPVWVAQSFHNLGNGSLSHRTGAVLHKGEWIVLEVETGRFSILTDQEFQANFREIPV